MSNSPVDDKLAAAIDSVESKEQAVALQQFNVTLSSTGRPALLAVPVDVSDGELAELCGWVLTGLMNAKRQERAAKPASRILVPAHLRPV